VTKIALYVSFSRLREEKLSLVLGEREEVGGINDLQGGRSRAEGNLVEVGSLATWGPFTGPYGLRAKDLSMTEAKN